MKKLGYLVLLLAPLGCAEKTLDDFTPAVAPTPSSIRVVETYLRGWSKEKNCIDGKGDCAVGQAPEIDAKTGLLHQRTPRIAVSIQDGQMVMTYLSAYDPTIEAVTIKPEGEYYVMDHVTKELGYHAIKVKQGVYSVDRTRGQYGTTRFDVELE